MIEIVPIRGMRAGVPGVLTDIDSVMWSDPTLDKPIEIGFCHRSPGAQMFLHYGLNVPESVIAEAKKKLRERDFASAPSAVRDMVSGYPDVRTVGEASGIEDDEESEDDDE